MYLAVYISPDEWEELVNGNEAVKAELRRLMYDYDTAYVISKDENGILSDVDNATILLCAHEQTYCDERSQTVCHNCGKELGR